MLTRRSSRVKVMQVLFTLDAQPDLTHAHLLNQLDESYRSSQRAFFLLMDQLLSTIGYAQTKREVAASSLILEEADVAEVRLLDNPIITMFQGSAAWQERLRKEHVNDDHDAGLVRHLYRLLSQHPVVTEYISRPTNTPDEDTHLVTAILTDVILDDEMFQSWIEEACPWWSDDVETLVAAVTHLITHVVEVPIEKQLKQLDEKATETLAFARELLIKTILHAEDSTRLIGPAATNWEVERIATIDMILMKMAIAEALEFPTIPVKVTINEYIDISKLYSTPKSKEFINGVLDKLIHNLRDEGKVVKTGRGLIET